MESQNYAITKLSYFAAANGYDGFRSYFTKVFAPEEYEAIYILKGGPGTGKSSYMKRLIQDFGNACDRYEAIYCSSDPKSLDGVILENKEHKIAVLDGTAPHATDPVYPGVVEEIVNLGDCWNRDLLKENTKNIKKHTLAKKRAYETAYQYLSIAGEFECICSDMISEIYNHVSMAEYIDAIPSGQQKHKKRVRLISSFGKSGFFALDTLSNEAKAIHSVVGIYGSEYIYMSDLKGTLDNAGISYTLFPSALSRDKYDAILLNSNSEAYVVGNIPSHQNDIIDTSRFLDQKDLNAEKTRLELAWREREIMLWNGAEEFKKASDAHFELEKYYTSAMDFSKIDTLYNECKSKIGNILKID